MGLRKFKPEDRQEWARMRTLLWPSSPEEHLEDIEKFLAQESIDVVEVFVLERDDSGLGGFIEINLRSYVEGSRAPVVPFVEAWFVDEDLREQGHGRALMQAAEDWAKAQGFSELGSDTTLDNEQSIAAHKTLGFKEVERIVTFLKRLT